MTCFQTIQHGLWLYKQLCMGPQHTQANNNQKWQLVMACRRKITLQYLQQTKKGNVHQYQAWNAHNVLFLQQKLHYIYCTILPPLFIFHPIKINYIFFHWLNELLILVIYSLQPGFPSALVLKFRDKTKNWTHLRETEKNNC